MKLASIFWLLTTACLLSANASLPAADPPPEQKQFQDFVRNAAAKMRAADRPPKSKDEWLERKAEIRHGLEQAWNFPVEKCPLEPKLLGEEQREVVKDMALLMIEDEEYQFDRPQLQRAVEEYWSK